MLPGEMRPPVRVSGGASLVAVALAAGCNGAVAIATTAFSTCAVIADGSLQCWGVDLERLMPSAVPGISGASALSVAELSTCAVVTGGQIRCWGDDSAGQLGDGVNPSNMTNPYNATPVTVVAGP
jgi:hypothetical protein